MTPLAGDVPRRDHYRFTATLVFARTEDGGREGPVASDYRVPCWFGLRTGNGDRLYNDCVFYFRVGCDAYEGPLDRLWVPAGGSCTADALAVYPKYVRPVAAVRARFVVWRGVTSDNAREALELYVEGLREEGRPIETGVVRRPTPARTTITAHTEPSAVNRRSRG